MPRLSPPYVNLLSSASPDALGGIELHAEDTPALRELGLESALGVILTDKETQAPAGAMLVGDAHARKWKPNESFFLQAVGDQLVLSVNHSRLRSLVRSLAVTDEKTGLLSRGAYIDCLLAETNRARTQSTPLSLIILQLDHGSELLRQHGDAALEQYVEQLARYAHFRYSPNGCGRKIHGVVARFHSAGHIAGKRALAGGKIAADRRDGATIRGAPRI